LQVNKVQIAETRADEEHRPFLRFRFFHPSSVRDIHNKMGTRQEEQKLSALPLGANGRVTALIDDVQARRRLNDLGIVEGTLIRALYQSPSGDPRAYLVRGTVIALRADTADKIILNPM